jgi:membrane fusion protein (multidrug efflux system)
MTKRMILMLLIALVIFGGVFGFQIFKGQMIKKYMALNQAPPAAVSTIRAEVSPWQPHLVAVGTLRAVRGVDVTTEVAGLVRGLEIQPGKEVPAGQLLVQLNADTDIAQLHSLEAAADLSATVYERDKGQYAVEAISKAALDADAADLKVKRAQFDQQAALVAKKAIRAPFPGRLGISTIQPGQYLNPGDKIVTLQQLDFLFADFYLPQQQLPQLAPGQSVTIAADSYPGRRFEGKITTIDPRVDSATRNVQIEARIANPKRELLPGMFATIEVVTGGPKSQLTLPATAISFNPYGATAYVVEQTQGADGKPLLKAQQRFVTTGETRGDQVAVLDGLRAGEEVVTSGQLKLKNGSTVVINNKLQPSNDPSPAPVDR